MVFFQGFFRLFLRIVPFRYSQRDSSLVFLQRFLLGFLHGLLTRFLPRFERCPQGTHTYFRVDARIDSSNTYLVFFKSRIWQAWSHCMSAGMSAWVQGMSASALSWYFSNGFGWTRRGCVQLTFLQYRRKFDRTAKIDVAAISLRFSIQITLILSTIDKTGSAAAPGAWDLGTEVRGHFEIITWNGSMLSNNDYHNALGMK